jgi:DNA-binding transcriptional ArsR family regulator
MDKAGTLTPKGEAILEKKADDEYIEEFDASSLVIIPVNSESKKLRQILSNETSMKILEILKQESMSLSELAERLDTPMTTAKYNLDILVENELVNIKRIKYSEKGRKVKIYEAPEKVIVFAPDKMSRFSLITMLQKYAFAFAAVGLLGVIFNSLYSRYVMPQPMDARVGFMQVDDIGMVAPTLPPDSAGEIASVVVDDVAAGPAIDVPLTFFQEISLSTSNWISSMLAYPSVWFIMGALMTCALIFIVEHVLVKREK